MNKKTFAYSLKVFRFDQLWLPLSIGCLFIIVSLFSPLERELMNITRGYLGAAVPLIGGIMAAYCLLDDPALELQFSTPVPAFKIFMERFIILFLLQAVTAVSFELFTWFMGGDYSIFISFWHVQLAWILPTVSLMALGSVCALITASSTGGALAVGLVWIVEVIARGWLAGNEGKYFLVFMGALMPDHPDLTANQIVVSGLSLIFLLVSWRLLRQEERFI